MLENQAVMLPQVSAAVSAFYNALVAIGATTRDAIGPGKQMLIRIVQMLTKLVQMYEADSVREEPTEYRADCDFCDGSDT